MRFQLALTAAALFASVAAVGNPEPIWKMEKMRAYAKGLESEPEKGCDKKNGLAKETSQKVDKHRTFVNGQLISCRPIQGKEPAGLCMFLKEYKKKEISGKEVSELALAASAGVSGCGVAWSKHDGVDGGGLALDYVKDVKGCSGLCRH